MNLKSFRDPRIAIPRTASKTIGVLAASLLLCASLFAPRAIAGIYTLNPGGDITATASLFPTGAHGVATNSSLFNSGTIDGSVTSIVFQGDTSNPYGGLTFTYFLTLFGDSSDSLSKMTVGSYGGFLTDVSYNSSFSAGVAPSDFSRNADGSILQFSFNNGGGLLPGENAAEIVVQTSAQGFKTAMGGVIDSIPANVSVLAPVPEPGVGSLFATGLGALLFWRRSLRRVART